jgi:hypothetical protein
MSNDSIWLGRGDGLEWGYFILLIYFHQYNVQNCSFFLFKLDSKLLFYVGYLC